MEVNEHPLESRLLGPNPDWRAWICRFSALPPHFGTRRPWHITIGCEAWLAETAALVDLNILRGGGSRNDPSTILVTFEVVTSAQLKVQSWAGAFASTWLHKSCAPPSIAAPPQLTGDAAASADAISGEDRPRCAEGRRQPCFHPAARHVATCRLL